MLKLGSQGDYVKQVQTFLNENGFPCGTVDGRFGPQLEAAVRAFQTHCMATPDGVWGTETFRDAALEAWQVPWPAPEGYPLIISAHFTTAERGPGDIDYVIMHTMEVPETAEMEVEISSRFSLESSHASTHFEAGETMIVQNVLCKDIAWAAEGGNRRGVSIELVGSATQSDAQWSDDFSNRTLANAAQLVADLCKRFDIPVAWLEGPGIKQGLRGITGHGQVNDAFKGVGQGHRDPGPHFPVARFLDAVQRAI